MSTDAFQTLRVLSQQVIDFAEPVPATQELIQNWHGAAFDVLGTRCVISADETRMIVDLGDTIPLPGVKHWVRGLANVGGRVVAISDLTSFLSGGAKTSGGKQALIVNGRGIHTGLMIEQSYGGVRLSTEQLRTDIQVADELQPYISGVFSTNDGDYALFDTSKLLIDANFTEASVITSS
ncbi:hypothetical protein BST95_05910 [Halioglobus japonicus]|uniref:CheW-like domain-containing protein n=1 Tax=Halioglobus japonicus TaxID=930805 RepID=A0AAP8MDH8_9GAMM|nr:chemotaxis protein CheW [Halioglobus japonicus]AQA17839.1 hypothetical protein BST95_05910 [Halioglobus japonicus]PLW85798.1 hypothetical protein C0029_14460 [Halioglobus japonicus]GHD17559.1 twitching motility protein PilT [Halioglobus japonicus]